jgi:adenylylsulfate kinase-like enzyme
VIATIIAPSGAEGKMVRDMRLPGDFIETYMGAPLAEAERRAVGTV